MILASTSPRRIELVRRLGIPVRVVEPIAEEIAGGDAVATAEENARRKALSVQADDVVLGADTVVCLDGELLGKPADDATAIAMLKRLAGRTHEVVTGVCLTDGTMTVTAHERTRVTFAPIGDDEIDRYVRAGKSRGKAGAYGIQDEEWQGKLTADGDYDNVVGLPVGLVALLIKEHFHGG